MPNSLRSRIKKLWYQGHLSRDDCDRIRDALDKQIPKKPNKAIDDCWGIEKEVNVCPCCDKYLGTYSFFQIGCVSQKVVWCESCGQKIDLSEVKDD